MGHLETPQLSTGELGRSQVVLCRFHGMEEVAGSNPARSTIHSKEVCSILAILFTGPLDRFWASSFLHQTCMSSISSMMRATSGFFRSK